VSLNAHERETVIVLNDEDDFATIYTAQRPWITRLRKNPAATLTGEGVHDGSVWARFEVSKALVSVRSKKVTLELTEEQRRERAKRLRKSLSAA